MVNGAAACFFGNGGKCGSATLLLFREGIVLPFRIERGNELVETGKIGIRQRNEIFLHGDEPAQQQDEHQQHQRSVALAAGEGKKFLQTGSHLLKTLKVYFFNLKKRR